MGEVYIWTTKNRPSADAEGGWTKGRKNYRHKIFVGLKKVVTGQSQIVKIFVSKVPRKMRKRTFLDMLPFVAYLRNIFRRSAFRSIRINM